MTQQNHNGQVPEMMSREQFRDIMLTNISLLIGGGPFHEGTRLLLSLFEGVIICAPNYWGGRILDYDAIGYEPVFPLYTREWAIFEMEEAQRSGNASGGLLSAIYPGETVDRDYAEYTAVWQRRKEKGLHPAAVLINEHITGLISGFHADGKIEADLADDVGMIGIQFTSDEAHILLSVDIGGRKLYRYYPRELIKMALSEFRFVLSGCTGRHI